MYTIAKNTSIFIVVVALTCAGCLEDPGNSALHEINKVNITGIASDYTVLLGEKLQITPTLNFTLDEAGDLGRYEFEWFLIENTFEFEKIHKTLGTTKDLDVTISYAPKTYEGYFKVTDTQTGVLFQHSFDVTVESTIGQGWMVLNEVSGGSRLDMVSLIDESYVVTHDVLASVNSSLELTGAPKDVACLPRSVDDGGYGIYVTTTGNGTTRIDPETFDWQPTYQIAYQMLDASLPTDYVADFIYPVSYNSFTFTAISYLYKDGNVYYGSKFYTDLPVNRVLGETENFYAAPFIANKRFSGYLYDMDNRRIVIHSVTHSCKTIPQAASTLFDYNDTGMDLVYMDGSWYNGGEVFAIMKVPDQETYYLARWNTQTQQQLYYQPMTATDIASATAFKVSVDFGYVFYSAGGKLYEYDFSLKTSKLMLDKGSSEITFLSSGDYFTIPGAVVNDLQRKLIVGTYDPSGTAGSNGTLEIFTIPPVNGDLELDASYDGFGRIVDVAYRQRP